MAIARNNFVSNTYMKHVIGLTVFVNLTPGDSFFLVACFVVVFAINVASESFDYFFLCYYLRNFCGRFYIFRRV